MLLGSQPHRAGSTDDDIRPDDPASHTQGKGKAKAASADLQRAETSAGAERTETAELAAFRRGPITDPGALYDLAIARATELGLKLPQVKRIHSMSTFGIIIRDKFFTKVKPQLRRDAALVQAGLFGLGMRPLTAAEFRAVLLAGVERRIPGAPLEKAASYLQEKFPNGCGQDCNRQRIGQ